jgi:type I restriction enzyme R subunit
MQETFDKKELSEQDICTKFILPALENAGWDRQTQLREQYPITKGRVIVKGRTAKRGESRRADYVLFYKPNIHIGVLEAKDNRHTVSAGMQQALGYSDMLDVPSVYSSNGDAFLEHNKTTTDGTIEKELPMEGFPSPDTLWRRYCQWKGIKEEYLPVITQDYYFDGSGKEPRYYQVNAVNKTVEAIAQGQDRVLLVMATGTGKTYTAFQIIYRLWKSGMKKRILFLADRNILVDQTKNNDFSPFGSAMTKIQKRHVDKSYEVYLCLYQAVTGTEEEKNIYKQFSPDFFDLIVVDECHRGSAREDSAWRDILDYFSSASQIGMTATPKETKYTSNIHYFGEPVYTYSLKQGIADGYLAPYKVIRIHIDRDLMGWRPEQGKQDKFGELIEDRIYNQKDFDRHLVIDDRTLLVAKKISDYLRATNRFDKTIVFCEDTEHAERMRIALANENADLVAENSKYVMRITGDDLEGKRELDNFIWPSEKYPVIVTTSRLMSTGVDAQTCKLIVLDRQVGSMTEFKQIVGRGTRINEEYDKYWFTIMDFRNATDHFADPDWDGDPVQVYEPNPEDSVLPPEDEEAMAEEQQRELEEAMAEQEDEVTFGRPDERSKRRKYYVNDVPVQVVAERVQYYGPDGKLITESLKDYTRKNILKEFESLDDFLRYWSEQSKKESIINALYEKGVLFEALADEVGRDYSPFDLICHVAFDQPPLTRKERANNVRKNNYFSKYSEACREVLDALLNKYADEGVENLDDPKILQIQPISRLGTPLEIIRRFGDKAKYQEALRELEALLYSVA